MFKNYFYPLLATLFIVSCTNPCKDTVCLNDGVCIDGTCVCPDGFYGDDCSLQDVTDFNNDTVFSSCESDDMNYNGYTYELIDINGKCWFKENLRTTKFSNGDDILHNIDFYSWTCDPQDPHEIPMFVEGYIGTDYYNQFGHLYNGFAVKDDRNICPYGWHVSTNEDWQECELLIGMSEDKLDDYGNHRGDNLRFELLSEEWFGNNSIGLSITPTGAITGCGEYRNELYDGLPVHYSYWTSTYANNNNLLYRTLGESFSNSINLSFDNLGQGFCVRCVKD